MPTLLEGDTLATWLELDEEERKEYEKVKEKMVEILMPTGLVTLDQLHQWKLMPGESLSVFIHDMKKMLEHAMPNIEGETRNKLLLHQLMAGLPSEISKQLRATGETKDLDETIRRARLLLSLEVQHAATATVSSSI